MFCEAIAYRFSACSLVGFGQGLSTSQRCFPLTTNQHQPDLSAHKSTSEQAQRNIESLNSLPAPTKQISIHGVLDFIAIVSHEEVKTKRNARACFRLALLLQN